MRDSLGNNAALAYGDVIQEPIAREPDGLENVGALIADQCTRCMGHPYINICYHVSKNVML